jgi:hypothetical protein
MSEQVFRWYVAIEYRPKMTRPSEVYWEITRDEQDQPIVDAGRDTSLQRALEDVFDALDDDVIAHRGPYREVEA